MLADSTTRVEINWIKAHVGHEWNERADQLAREAVKNSQVGVNTPQSWACYKAQLKKEIYIEWEQRWTNNTAYRMTKIFYPKPDSNKAKKILKLNRGQLKTLIGQITGQNNLNYMNNKVYGSEDLCRFCKEEEETFNHIINEYPCFHLDRCDLLQNQPIINTCLLYTSPSPRDS